MNLILTWYTYFGWTYFYIFCFSYRSHLKTKSVCLLKQLDILGMPWKMGGVETSEDIPNTSQVLVIGENDPNFITDISVLNVETKLWSGMWFCTVVYRYLFFFSKIWWIGDTVNSVTFRGGSSRAIAPLDFWKGSYEPL